MWYDGTSYIAYTFYPIRMSTRITIGLYGPMDGPDEEGREMLHYIHNNSVLSLWATVIIVK